VRFARLDDSTVAVGADATPPGRSRLILEAALGYAEDGIPVLPAKPNAKVPLTGNGLHAATLDRSRIERWWRYWPDANLAMVTGAPGYNVLDVDVRLDGSGMETFEQLKRAGLLAGILGLARTPSGGLHAFFPGTQERCSKLSGRHIDFKAAGGYVLASPSHVVTAEYSGDYSWLFPIEGEGTPLDWPRISSIYEPTKGKRTCALVPRGTREGSSATSETGLRVSAITAFTGQSVKRSGMATPTYPLFETLP